MADTGTCTAPLAYCWGTDELVTPCCTHTLNDGGSLYDVRTVVAWVRDDLWVYVIFDSQPENGVKLPYTTFISAWGRSRSVLGYDSALAVNNSFYNLDQLATWWTPVPNPDGIAYVRFNINCILTEYGLTISPVISLPLSLMEDKLNSFYTLFIPSILSAEAFGTVTVTKV